MKTNKQFICQKCPHLPSMYKWKYERHMKFHSVTKRIRKPRNFRRDIPSFCKTCSKTIPSDWNRHRRLVHNDKKAKTTPTFGQSDYDADDSRSAEKKDEIGSPTFSKAGKSV